jgi:hypothetical protein
MRVLALSLAIFSWTASTAVAAPGDQWILGIHQLNEGSTFTENIGAGYSGAHSSGNSDYFGNAYSHYGFAGDIARVNWKLDGLSVNTGRPVPTTTEQYTIEYFGVPQPSGHNDYQPIESQFHGEGGEAFPYEDDIPWVGQFNTNHQWIKLDDTPVVSQWNTTGPGPQVPNSANFNASGFGTRMWLTRGSWLYAKWDFPFEIDRSWSAIRLTQVTLDGDHNRDGVVSAADYAAWRKIRPGGDGGYDSFYSNFGMTAAGSGGSAAVPEPTSVSLVILCVAARMCLAARHRLQMSP